MTTNHHTPISNGAYANSDTINNPLEQLDEAISDLALTERDGHIIQDEGVDLAQQQRLNFAGAGVTVTNDGGNNRTLVTIPGGITDHGALSGLADDDHPQYHNDTRGDALYLQLSGLSEWNEQAGDPPTPSANKWKLYFKSGGLYIIDDTGAVIGPVGANVSVREKLSGNRTYYVRTDGSNSNNGLTNTSGGAFLTLGYAYLIVLQSLDLNGYTVTIKVADGTYTAGINASGPLVGGGALVIEGNTATPANCIINATSANAFSAAYSASFTVKGFKITTTTAGSCIYALYNGIIYFDKINFGACAASHMTASDGGRIMSTLVSSYTISGGAVSHVHAYAMGEISIGYNTITVTGTPAFSVYFAGTAVGFISFEGSTFSGGATGTRYLSHKNGVIDTNSAGSTFLPGSVAGSTATGGQYI